jgi:hypothetical protein
MAAIAMASIARDKLTPVGALGIAAALAVAIAGYIAISTTMGIRAFYAGSIFAFYWTTIGKTELRELPAALMGSLCGIATATLFAMPISSMGGAGPLLGLLAIALALYFLLMRWIPMVVNPAYMLMLTVSAIPPVLAEKPFLSMAEAVCLAALYVGILVGVGQFLLTQGKGLLRGRFKAESVSKSGGPL